ncbi:MAG TPA: hypothetical protein VF752_12050 [Thermoleophilaceae bacterium]
MLPQIGRHAAADQRADAAKSRTLAPPRPLAPGDGAQGPAMPAFSWGAVRSAAKYEFQLSADRTFNSAIKATQTLNTFATIDKSLTDGTYYWRVRSISSKDVAGEWSRSRAYTKSWTDAPHLLSPADNATISYPDTPLVLHWSAVPRASKYLVYVATDPALGSLVVSRTGGKPVETSGTSFAVPASLAPGRYYWGITPEDTGGHDGEPSAVGSFDWSWGTGTSTTVEDATGSHESDGAGRPKVLSPNLSWGVVPGAARYEVEVNTFSDFPPGSKVCCNELTTGTSLSPTRFLANNVYHWRVRAIDLNGNAGGWNVGPDFRKAFDDVTPTIPNLTLRDNTNTPLAWGASTAAPLLTWDPVPGASSYELDVAPWNSVISNCDFGSSATKTYITATTAWTPLADSSSTNPGPLSWPGVSTNSGLGSGDKCVRVMARTDKDLKNVDVVSGATQQGGSLGPAFTYTPVTGSGPLGDAQESDYLSMTTPSSTTDMPVFRWKPIAGASSYYVVVSKDSSFTNVVDVALTKAPAYAPRRGTLARTYSDENTDYYWQVLPAAGGSGTLCPCTWDTGAEHPQRFQKSSIPPTPLSPTGGSGVGEQPTFRWSLANANFPSQPATQGAKTYRLQVSGDPTFSDPIDDITTDSTSYTSTSTYPADTILYWRVRVNDENNVALNWSSIATFRRTLRTPSLSADNPTVGPDVPVVRWDSVSGATSYTLHVEQGDGTAKSFDTRSTAFTPTGFFGVGNVRWQVRANFPKASSGETAGPFSDLQTFTRQIAAPTGVRWTNTPRHVLLSWDPSTNIGTRSYRAQISKTNSFSTLVDSHVTENTSYAPLLTQSGFKDGGTLYWRVASLDERGTLGAWTVRTLTLPGRMNLKIEGSLRLRRSSVVRITALNVRGRPIRGARVSVSGIGVSKRAKRTGKRGTVAFKLRASRKGSVVFTGSKSGYQSGRVTIVVR